MVGFLLRSNFPWTTHISSCLLSRGTERFCSRLFFQGCLYKQTALDERESVSFLGQKTDLLALYDLKMFVGSALQKILAPQL